MKKEANAKPNPYADIAPALGEYTTEVLFGDVWERTGLSPRDRSLVTVATLVALYRTNELPFHLKRAIENGVTKYSIRGIRRRSLMALVRRMRGARRRRCGVSLTTSNEAAGRNRHQPVGLRRDGLPRFVASPRRCHHIASSSLRAIEAVALATTVVEFREWSTQEELIEVITHLAFYAGWPSANTAVVIARDVFGKEN